MQVKSKQMVKITTFNSMTTKLTLMKRLAMALAIPVLMAGCNSKCIEDSGNHIQIQHVVKSFDKIKVTGSVKLVMKQDSSYSISIEADSNILKHLIAEVSGSELRIKLEEGKYCGTDSVVVYAGIGELKQLHTDGAVKVAGNERIYANDLDFNFTGTSDVNLNLSVGKLTTKIDGVGKLSLSGQAGVHDLNTKGTASLSAFDFVAGEYEIDIEGTGKANINVLNELKVTTSGTSEVYYKGNPKKVNEKKSGATKLEKVN